MDEVVSKDDLNGEWLQVLSAYVSRFNSERLVADYDELMEIFIREAAVHHGVSTWRIARLLRESMKAVGS